MKIKDELLRIIDSLNSANLQYAVCGGFAVALHGHPRLTRDIDLVVHPDQLDAILKVVADAGFTINAAPMAFNEGHDSEQIVHRVSKFEGTEFLSLDLLMVSTFLQAVWDSRIQFEMEGRRVSVVDKNGLIKMKQSAARPQDLADIENLKSS